MISSAVHRVRDTVLVDVGRGGTLAIRDLGARLDWRRRRVGTSAVHDEDRSVDTARRVPTGTSSLEVAGTVEVGKRVAALVVAAGTEAGGEVGTGQGGDVAVLPVIAAGELRDSLLAAEQWRVEADAFW